MVVIVVGVLEDGFIALSLISFQTVAVAGCRWFGRRRALSMTQYIAVAPAPFTGTNFQFPDNDNMFSYSVAKFGGNITS
jgi:hypothetical protein